MTWIVFSSLKSFESKQLLFSFAKGIKSHRKFTIEDNISSIDICGDELVMSSYSGQIQSFDCAKAYTKWIAYSERKVTGAVVIGDRVVISTDDGQIECIYLDQQLNCDICQVTFARQMDLKKHIQIDHKTDTSDQTSAQSSAEPEKNVSQ